MLISLLVALGVEMDIILHNRRSTAHAFHSHSYRLSRTGRNGFECAINTNRVYANSSFMRSAAHHMITSFAFISTDINERVIRLRKHPAILCSPKAKQHSHMNEGENFWCCANWRWRTFREKNATNKLWCDLSSVRSAMQSNRLSFKRVLCTPLTLTDSN